LYASNFREIHLKPYIPLQNDIRFPITGGVIVRRVFTKDDITLSLFPRTQVNALDEAAKQNPDAWWWVKADGCDIKKGLKESSRLEWRSLANESLQEKYGNYRERLKTMDKVGLCDGNVVQDF